MLSPKTLFEIVEALEVRLRWYDSRRDTKKGMVRSNEIEMTIREVVANSGHDVVAGNGNHCCRACRRVGERSWIVMVACK